MKKSLNHKGSPEKQSVDDAAPVESRKKKPITKPHDSSDEFTDDDSGEEEEAKHKSKKLRKLRS